MGDKVTCPDCGSDKIIEWGDEYTCASCTYGWDAEAQERRMTRKAEEGKWQSWEVTEENK